MWKVRVMRKIGKPKCRCNVLHSKMEEGNGRKGGYQSKMCCFQLDKNIHTTSSYWFIKKMEKGRGSAFCIALPLQSTKKGHMHAIRTIVIDRHKQWVMYAYNNMCSPMNKHVINRYVNNFQWSHDTGTDDGHTATTDASDDENYWLIQKKNQRREHGAI